MDLIVLFRCGRSGRTVAEGDGCPEWEPREPRPERVRARGAIDTNRRGMER